METTGADFGATSAGRLLHHCTSGDLEGLGRQSHKGGQRNQVIVQQAVRLKLHGHQMRGEGTQPNHTPMAQKYPFRGTEDTLGQRSMTVMAKGLQPTQKRSAGDNKGSKPLPESPWE